MIIYFSKLILSSGLLLAFYLGILEKVKIYQFNRWYLILALLIPFGIPLIEFEIQNILTQNDIAYSSPISNTIEQVRQNLEETKPQMSRNPKNTIILIIWAVYGLITGLLIFRFLKNIYALQKIRQSGKSVKKDGFQIVLTNDNQTPFSFLKSIFLNKELFENDKLEKEILDHEIAHVNQGHSYDILFLETLVLFFWFNPFLFFYRKSMRLNHEFLADEETLNKYENKNRYQYLILNEIGLQPTELLASKFNYSFIKKRLKMMNKSQNKKKAQLAKLIVLPFLLIIISVFGKISIAQNQEKELTLNPKPSNEASEAQMIEYKKLVEKYVLVVGKTIRISELTDNDRERLKVLFLGMNKKQQASQKYIMAPPIAPFPKTTPTEKEFENYKNAKIYGVWMNDKKIKNSELAKYNAEDIHQVFVSKLMPNAQKTIGYKYKYQVDMMTKDHYEKYKTATLQDKRYYLTTNWVGFLGKE
jgi:bla regulator protein blaR1